jgi:signal transduction histidine kinase
MDRGGAFAESRSFHRFGGAELNFPDTMIETDALRHTNALLQLKACFWSGSVHPLRAQVESPAPPELADFESGGIDWFEGIYPTDLEKVTGRVAAAAKGTVGEPLEYRMVTEKRGIVWVRHWFSDASSEARSAGGGQVSGFIQVWDERKLLEAECLRICEREKTSIGQELHDDVCQLLAGLSCMLEVIGQRAKTAMPDLTPTFKDLAAQLHGGMERTRSLSHSLVPLRLINLGLARALRELARQAEKNFKVQVNVTVPRSIPAHESDQILHLCRMVQEAISNAVKHGKATKVTVELARQRTRMNLTIHDNGTGLPPASNRREGIGLHIMRYRAGALGGHFAISSQPKNGSTVSITYDCTGAPKRIQKIGS